MIKAKTQDKKNDRKKTKFYLYISFSVLLIISIVLVTVHGSTLGAELASLEKKESELIKEISEDKDKLARSGSLTEFAGKAEEMGFVKPDNIIYIGQEKEFAVNR